MLGIVVCELLMLKEPQTTAWKLGENVEYRICIASVSKILQDTEGVVFERLEVWRRSQESVQHQALELRLGVKEGLPELVEARQLQRLQNLRQAQEEAAQRVKVQ